MDDQVPDPPALPPLRTIDTPDTFIYEEVTNHSSDSEDQQFPQESHLSFQADSSIQYGSKPEDDAKEHIYESIEACNRVLEASCENYNLRETNKHATNICPDSPIYHQLEKDEVEDTASKKYHRHLSVSSDYTNPRQSYAELKNDGYEDIVPNSAEQCNSEDYQPLVQNETMEKIRLFHTEPKEFISRFECSHDEKRIDEEAFIIEELLKETTDLVKRSPILGGDLWKLALLACLDRSPHVVRRALDALLNEVFLCISDYSRTRCYNIVQAEEILRQTFPKFLSDESVKASHQRMTTYAWLLALVLLKCSEDELSEMRPKVKRFDKKLEALQFDKENSEKNLFRYGIHISRESIRRIAIPRNKKGSGESMIRLMRKCESILSSDIKEEDVMKLCKAMNNGGSWLDLHVCLLFLQDLPKLHRFRNSIKPVILTQMLVADYRKNKDHSWTIFKQRFSNCEWKFELLVYRVMLRLLRTSTSKAIIDEVLNGVRGSGGIVTNWFQNRLSQQDTYVYKLCKEALFFATSTSFKMSFIENCWKSNEKQFIEDISIIRLSTKYRDKVLQITRETRTPVFLGQNCVSVYDVLMSSRERKLKLYQHSKQDVLERKNGVLRKKSRGVFPFRDEIHILEVLNSNKNEPCPNILRLFYSSTEFPMHMIVESLPQGDLLRFLKSLKTPPEADYLRRIALDVCNAMIYLGSRDVIHRDLRAKNCFIHVKDNKTLTKIGDFHLAVLTYSAGSTESLVGRDRKAVTSLIDTSFLDKFSARWLALESLQVGEFSTKSDVWSFGILLFEIFTFGAREPYIKMPSGTSLNCDEDVREYVLKGNRLERHPKIPGSIWRLIELTMVNVHHRPSFQDLKSSLEGAEFEDDIYEYPVYYKVSRRSLSEPNLHLQIHQANASTDRFMSGYFGKCHDETDIATPFIADIDGKPTHFIKEIVPALSRQMELKILMGLQHPSMAVVTEKVVHGLKVELITRVGDLGTFEEFIKQYGYSKQNVVTYLLNIGEAISFLHSKRFIHRNLRASSVYIFSNGFAKLACFGRARQLTLDDDRSSTLPITLSMPDDSLTWSSPEVISNGEYNKASDVWAFAVLIWELFTLIDSHDEDGDDEIFDLPYEMAFTKKQLLAHLSKGKRFDKPRSCPDWLYDLMRKCWKYDAKDRCKIEDLMDCAGGKSP